MPAELIDGKAIAATIRAEVAVAGKELLDRTGVQVCLAVVLVGERPDSAVYVRMKKKALEEAGFINIDKHLSAEVSEADLLAAVDELNADKSVHGILVQLPLPGHINEARVLARIETSKDVDGFKAENIGHLALRGCTPNAVSCTPAGCVELLKRSGVQIAGKEVVVVGRSNIVGMPVAFLLQQADATVTMCHSRTADLPGHVRRADIVIAAIGKPHFVKGEWLKEGAVVIDVGINSIEDASTKKGTRLVGDVEFEAAKEKASLITPVPGGVGPMTIAMLLTNVLSLAKAAASA